MDKTTENKAKRIATLARKSICKFCFEECKAYCCRKSYLILKKNQVDFVMNGRGQEYVDKNILKTLENGSYSLFMGKEDLPCPALKDFMCTIHNSKMRPKTCSDYPLFIEEDYLLLSPRCLAVKLDLLYVFIRKLLALGYKLKGYTPYYEIETDKLDFLKPDKIENKQKALT